MVSFDRDAFVEELLDISAVADGLDDRHDDEHDDNCRSTMVRVHSFFYPHGRLWLDWPYSAKLFVSRQQREAVVDWKQNLKKKKKKIIIIFSQLF